MPAVGAAHVAAFKRGHRNLPMPAGGNQSLPVTYPTSHLGTKVWIAPGADLTQPPTTWPWTDITQYVRHQSAITVSTGRKDEHALVEAGSGDLTLDNRDGRFSRRNPASPYYPLLTKNTPILAVVDPGSGQVPRMQMFVNNWPNRSDIAGVDVTMPISCAGVLRRLGQGSVLKSPLRRAISAAEPTLYWPFEDGGDTTMFSSGLTGGSSVAFTDTTNVIAAGEDRIVGSISCVSLNCADNGSAIGSVGLLSPVAMSGFSATGFSFACAFAGDFAASPKSVDWRVLRFDLSGASGIDSVNVTIYASTTSGVADNNFGVALSLLNGGTLVAFAGYDSTVASPLSYPNPFDGNAHAISGTLAQSGSNISITLTVDGQTFTGTASSKTLGTPATLSFPSTYTTITFGGADSGDNRGSSLGLGHVAVWSGGGVVDPYDASIGYVGEQAHTRIIRLCNEEGIPVQCVGAESTLMGPQSVDTFLNIVREAESADLGVLYEVGFGLGYQCRSERHNAPVALNLDFNRGNIANPPGHEDDDQQLRNQWTVTRKVGSATGTEATIRDAANIAANGLYDDSAEVNLYTDNQAPNAASWRVHLGTVDVERWPDLAIDFASTGGGEVIPGWLALGYGARVQIANPPDTYSPEDVDVFVEGWTERWDPISWDATFNTSPAPPYEVYQVGSTSGNRGRVDSASSTLTADPGVAGTSLTVASTGTTWIDSATYPSLFPFDIELTGERVTVTAISGTTSPQTFTVTRSVNGVVLAHAARTTVRLWKPPVYAM